MNLKSDRVSRPRKISWAARNLTVSEERIAIAYTTVAWNLAL